MRLSTVILARDEAATIGAAIASVRAISDEVVVCVDPRTIDDTTAVAEAAGARVGSFDTWPGMEQARNMSLDACGAPWALMLDGHEVLDRGHETIRRLVEHDRPDRPPWLSLLLVTSEREGGVVAPVPRLVHRDSVQIGGEEHPLPRARVGGTGGSLLADCLLRHDDPKSDTAQYAARQSERFERMVATHLGAGHEDGTARTPFIVEAAYSEGVFHFAASYGAGWVSGPGKQAQPERRMFVGCIAAAAFLAMGDVESALRLAREMVGDYPGYPRSWIALGDACLDGSSPQHAVQAYLTATRCPDPRFGWYRRRDNTWLPHTRLALTALRSASIEAATTHLADAIGACYDPPTSARLSAIGTTAQRDSTAAMRELAGLG